jgi:hypothetical protein
MDRVLIFDTTLRDDLDVIEASARAYINAVNRLVHPVKGRDVQEVGP